MSHSSHSLRFDPDTSLVSVVGHTDEIGGGGNKEQLHRSRRREASRGVG